jgi:hypothetical protein
MNYSEWRRISFKILMGAIQKKNKLKFYKKVVHER